MIEHGLTRRTLLQRGAGVAVAAAAPSLLGACGGDGGSDGAIAVWKPPHVENEPKYWKSQFTAYGKAHPDIEVTFRETPWDAYLETYTSAFAAGRGPDVFYSVYIYYPRFASARKLADLSKLPGGRFGTWQELADKGIYDSSVWKQGTYDGVVYGIPFVATGPSLVYNKKLFTQAGLDPDQPPETWERVIEYARELTMSSGKQWGFGALDNSTGQMLNFAPQPVINYGGDLTSPDNTEWIAVGEGYVDGLETHVRMFREDKTAAPLGTYSGNDVFKAFLDGKIAMINALAQFIEPVLDKYPDFELGVAPPPSGPENGQTVGGAGWWMVSKEDQDREDVAALMEMLTSSDQMARFARLSGLFPARKDVKPFKDKPVLQQFADNQGPYARLPSLKVDPWASFCSEIEAAYAGRKPAATALEDAAEKINKAISAAGG